MSTLFWTIDFPTNFFLGGSEGQLGCTGTAGPICSLASALLKMVRMKNSIAALGMKGSTSKTSSPTDLLPLKWIRQSDNRPPAERLFWRGHWLSPQGTCSVLQDPKPGGVGSRQNLPKSEYKKESKENKEGKESNCNVNLSNSEPSSSKRPDL